MSKYEIEDMKNAAKVMIDNFMDYWPNMKSFGADDSIGLYAYDDGVWLVDTLNSCSMNDAIKLVKVL